MGCEVKKITNELATVVAPSKQGNKRKRRTIFKQQFKSNPFISLLYIFYYVNFFNWSNGGSRPSVAPYVTAAAISKLDTFYYRNVNSLHRNESNQNFGSNITALGVPLQSTDSISLGKIDEISAENFVNHEAAIENFVMLRTPSSRLVELAKCVSSNNSHITSSVASSRCSLSRRERRVDDNKLRNTMELFLLKWKIRKKIRNKRYVPSLKTNEMFVKSIEETLATTVATATTSFDSSLNNSTDFSYLNSTDYDDDYSGAIDDDGDNILINISTITQMPLVSTITSATATIPYTATSEYNSLARQIDPTQRAIITHFLNRFKENNVFEMATKLKYNKLSAGVGGVTDKAKNGFGKVSLLGLFELSTRDGIRPEGRSELAAAQLAVRHINERHILPGYTLELLTNDTKVRDTNSSFLSTFCFYLLNYSKYMYISMGLGIYTYVSTQ